MTRALVLGAGGMLGHKVVQALAPRFDTWATVRECTARTREALGLGDDQILGNVSVTEPDSLAGAIARVRPDVVVNCIGIVKQAEAATNWQQSIEVNGVLPHRLAALGRRQAFRLIHVSTDCVFTGHSGNYTEGDQPDARDIYGLSKLVGEVGTEGCLTLRTSIIGRELGIQTHGLVEWYLAQQGQVRGFRRAVFSGLPTVVLAALIADIIDRHPQLSGLFHVSADPIDKCTLLRLIRQAFDASAGIDSVDDPRLDRSLDSTAFRRAISWHPPAWPALVERMFQDARPYPYLRNVA